MNPGGYRNGPREQQPDPRRIFSKRTTGRIQSIDFWRGVVLLAIFVDHIPGNPVSALTPRNFGFSDAAEAFIFLSGLVLAYACWPRIAAARIGEVVRRCLRRAGEFYFVQVSLSLSLAAGDLAAFRSYVVGGVTAARQAGVRVLLLDPQFYPGVLKHQERYEGFVAALAAIGAENQVPVLSRYAMMKAWSATDGLLPAMLAPDRFHMNDRGYGCVAEALADRIADILPRPAVAEAPTAPVVPASATK